jgi:AraC-like DNA-binding protein
MLAIPVPFVVAIVLAILLGVIVSRREGRSMLPLTVFLGAALIQATLVGLRWSVDWQVARLIQPFGAALAPPLAWWVVADLSGARLGSTRRALAGAGVVTVLLALWWRQPIDAGLIGLYLAAGGAILTVALGGADRFGAARLADVGRARFASAVLGVLLIASAGVDALTGIALYQHGPTVEARRQAAAIISIGSLVVLLTAAAATIVIASTRTADVEKEADAGIPPDPEPEAVAGEAEDAAVEAESLRAVDLVVLGEVDAVLRGRALYRDPDLSLDRLARRVHRPARMISGAINRVHGMNVSQYVNGLRVEDALRLLAETDRPVTAILHEVGFQTKSNFHREFSRVAGCSPSEWRARARGDAEA